MKIQSLRAEDLTLILTNLLHELVMRKGPLFRDFEMMLFDATKKQHNFSDCRTSQTVWSFSLFQMWTSKIELFQVERQRKLKPERGMEPSHETVTNESSADDFPT